MLIVENFGFEINYFTRKLYAIGAKKRALQ